MPLFVSGEVTQVTQSAPVIGGVTASILLSNIPVRILTVDLTRKGFSIFNNGTEPICLGESDAPEFFVEIPPKSFYEWGFANPFTGELWAFCNTGTTFAKVFSFS